MKIEYKIDRGGVYLISEYWKAIHQRERGGTLSSLIFKYGSGNNILVSPLTSYITRKEGSEYIYYEESLCRKPQITARKEDGKIVIESFGKYTSLKGKELPVIYRRRYKYEEFGLIKVSIEMEFTKSIDWIIAIGVSSFRVAKSLNTIGYRPAPEMGKEAALTLMCEWYEFEELHTYKSSQSPKGRYIPIYICVLNRGIEGFEFFRGDALKEWDKSFIDEARQEYWEASYDISTDSFLIRIEPYANWLFPITIGPGKYQFNYYLGFPFSKGQNKVHTPYFHVAINSRWPDERQLDIYASSGVKLIRLHNDYREDGPFWHDGCYPPYDKENMKKMDWVIKEVHKRGMKIVPYFSLKECHPDCPSYKENVDKWKRTIDKKLSVIHNYVGSGEFGAQMCLRSSWLEFRKKTIDIVLSNHDFDGVYYDWTLALYCNNPTHLKGEEHIDMDEFIEFLQWTRKRVGPTGIIFLHMSGVPMMVAENMANLIFTHEELIMVSPRPGGFSPEVDFAGITGHQIVRNFFCKEPTGEKKFVLSCFVEGFWTCPRTGTTHSNDPVLIEMRKFSKYDLTLYKYEPASRIPLLIDSNDIWGSFYWNSNSALIYLVNLSDKSISFNWRVDLSKKGWDNKRKIRIQDSSTFHFSTVNKLLKSGIRTSLSPLSSTLIEINGK